MDRDLLYAKRVGEIGEKILKVSKRFTNVNYEDTSKLNVQYNNYLKGINEYKECKVSLNNILPPSKVKIEHDSMVDAMELFITGTEFMFKSININDSSIDKDTMNKGLLMQDQGKKTIVRLCDEIASKLIG